MRTKYLLPTVLTALLLTSVAYPQGSIDETWIRTTNPAGGKSLLAPGTLYPLLMFRWSPGRSILVGNCGIEANGISDRRMYWCEEFMGYSNGTAGVAILSSATAPSGTTVLTPADWYWGSSGTNGTVKLIAGTNGTAVLSTGTTTNNTAVLSWRESNFSIASNPSLEALVKLSTTGNVVYEIGWYVDTSDEILFRFDSSVNSTQWLLVYENTNQGEQVYVTTRYALASVYTKLRIDLFANGSAKCYVNDNLVKSYPAGTVRNVAFKPRFYVKTLGASDKNLTVDYCKLWQDR